MVDAQILSKVLDTSNIEIITHNGLNSEYFPNYSDEFKFILDHYRQYNVVPDKETFLSKFPDFPLVKVNESDVYLLDKLNEIYLYNKMVPILTKVNDLLTKDEDSRKAIEYLQQEIPFLTSKLKIDAQDIVKNADIRVEELEKRKDGKYFITTGFRELDNALMGWQRGEDLVTVMGRTNEGKCIEKGTLVLMADGTRKKIEDIIIGDKVQSENGINTVVATHNGISGGYKIKPRLGLPFIVSDNHILTFNRKIYKNDKYVNTVREDISVEDYIKRFPTKYNRYYFKHTLVRPCVEYSEKKLDIPPYILGIWLGDGTSCRPELTNVDEEVIKEWKNFASKFGLDAKIRTKSFTYDITSGNKFKNKILSLFKENNLLNNKHIPIKYLTSSREQRLELLAGIIDTDGCLTKNKREFEICTKLETLKNDYIQLITSLGFGYYIRETKIKVKGESHGYYRIFIIGKLATIPTRIPRKKADNKLNNGFLRRNTITPCNETSFKIERVKQVEYYGFECDGDHRFLLSDCTLVHNTWCLLKFLESAWLDGYRVGLYSGEMSGVQVGFRFDTLYNNFSNTMLTKGSQDIEQYKEYVADLKQKNSFFVITPEDMGGNCTVTKLEAFIQKYKLDILGVDQYSLMDDENFKPGQPLRMKYDNISKGLFQLSCKYHIPVLAAVQANRASVTKDKKNKAEGPKLEHISEADAIAHNSSRVIAMRQNEGNLEFEIVKNRIGGRNGKYLYRWLIDTGKFEYVPTLANNDHKQVEEIRKQFRDKEDVF